MLILAALFVVVLVVSFSGAPRNACPNVEPGVTPNPVLAAACPTPSS